MKKMMQSDVQSTKQLLAQNPQLSYATSVAIELLSQLPVGLSSLPIFLYSYIPIVNWHYTTIQYPFAWWCGQLWPDTDLRSGRTESWQLLLNASFQLPPWKVGFLFTLGRALRPEVKDTCQIKSFCCICIWLAFLFRTSSEYSQLTLWD